MKKIAIVLFNLGGPDGPEAVEPFLFNLFNDPAIINAPAPIRWLLAKLISRKRAPIARKIYAHLGSSSPLLPNTEAQAAALEAALRDFGLTHCFVAMRYWKPFIEDAVAAVKAFAPDRILLLPLYPQFSTTTTGSSWQAWRQAARKSGISPIPTTLVCCYPREPGFVEAVASRVREGLAKIASAHKPRVLFSAHGLPKRIVDRGDPYRWQVEETCSAVVAALGHSDLDWRICYQSRVGRLEWIGPSTDAEIEQAGRDRVPVVVTPIAFVSEHSETLVELDIEYRALAQRSGVPAYVRVPTVSTSPEFVAGLAGLARRALAAECSPWAGDGARICPAGLGCCPMARTDGSR